MKKREAETHTGIKPLLSAIYGYVLCDLYITIVQAPNVLLYKYLYEHH